jgi:hypothetical protein
MKVKNREKSSECEVWSSKLMTSMFYEQGEVKYADGINPDPECSGEGSPDIHVY